MARRRHLQQQLLLTAVQADAGSPAAVVRHHMQRCCSCQHNTWLQLMQGSMESWHAACCLS
jgi:hypothetical protein